MERFTIVKRVKIVEAFYKMGVQIEMCFVIFWSAWSTKWAQIDLGSLVYRADFHE